MGGSRAFPTGALADSAPALSSNLEGHPTPSLPFVEVATGSLGQGLPVGIGIALAARLDRREQRVYVLMGDGESAEGSVWEAAEIASSYNIDNLCAIIDVNRLGQLVIMNISQDYQGLCLKNPSFSSSENYYSLRLIWRAPAGPFILHQKHDKFRRFGLASFRPST